MGSIAKLRVKEQFVPMGVEWRGRAKDLADLPEFDYLVTRIKDIEPGGDLKIDFAEGPDTARVGDWIVRLDGGDWEVWKKEEVKRRYSVEYPIETVERPNDI